jgi:hypothetical protein
MKAIDQIGYFWIVTFPNSVSELADICWDTNINGLIRQVNGGLKEEAIAGIYQNESQAKLHAEKLLAARRGI